MTLIRSLFIAIFCISSGPIWAVENVSEAESQQYYFGLTQKAKAFRVELDAAGQYLRGVWRLDRKAHIGAGHYARADKGDDVVLICNNEQLVQVDFSRNHDEFVEVVAQLAEIAVEEDGSWSFGKRRRYVPLDDNHMAVVDYDYIVVLQRESGPAENSE